MENKCAALRYPHWNIHQHCRVIHHVLVLSFGCFCFTFCRKEGGGGRGRESSQQQLERKRHPRCFCARKKKKEKAKQPDPVTAYRPGERSVSSVNRSSTTERPHKSPQLLTSPSMGKQYCDNGAVAAGSLAELSIWSSGNGSIRLQMCAQFFSRDKCTASARDRGYFTVI